MPRVDVPVTVVSRAGLAVSETTGDATNNHSFVNDGNTILVARNSASTSTRTVTLLFSLTPDGQAVTSRTVQVPVSSLKFIGPFPVDLYGSTVQVNVDHADLKLQAVKVQGG